ncbi:unnamed protein product [Dicrocoelium dendriticum]|nr:unnamed protein product [Dicrocoelium dendriticum]
MNNASNSSTSRRHSLGTESSNSRFYLHHHAPDHISKRTMSMMRRVSSVALHHVSTAAINPWKHGSE